MRYTFGLTDVAVNLLLGTKYQPVLFCHVDFKINSVFKKCSFNNSNSFTIFWRLKVVFFFCFCTLFLFHKHTFPVIPQMRDCHFFSKKNHQQFVLSIVRRLADKFSFLPGKKYFYQYQCFVFTTRAFIHVNAKAFQHADLQRDFY